MELKIGEKTYTMYFGLDFIAELDKRSKLRISQLEELNVGTGIAYAVTHLELYSPLVLLDIIAAATVTEKSKPSKVAIIEFVESSDIEELCDSFLEQLQTSPMTSPMLKQWRKQAEKTN